MIKNGVHCRHFIIKVFKGYRFGDIGHPMHAHVEK